MKVLETVDVGQGMRKVSRELGIKKLEELLGKQPAQQVYRALHDGTDVPGLWASR